MSRSTTSTATYTLTKYSRAYAKTNGQQEIDAEWQHFTNPIIRLVLDITKSAKGDLESYRVRILWSLNAGEDSMDTDQRDVVFEDLELLAFSSTPQQSFAAHGLPLKAVYRDAVVGIRYMHPKVAAAGTNPSYRRFQMNFQNVTDASSFIEAVCHVCPCKANPPAQPAQALPRSATMVAPHSKPSALARMMMPPPPVPALINKPLRASATMQPPQVSGNPSSPGSRMSISSLVTESPISSVASRTPQPPSSGGSSTALVAPVSASNSSGNNSEAAPALAIPASGIRLGLSDVPSPADQRQPEVLSYQLASRSSAATGSAYTDITEPRPLVASSSTAEINPAAPAGSRSTANPTPSAPPPSQDSLASTGDTGMDVDTPDVDSLGAVFSARKVPALYDLSRAELETLVGEVVREEGFVKLVSPTILGREKRELRLKLSLILKLENLDSMWRVKALLG